MSSHIADLRAAEDEILARYPPVARPEDSRVLDGKPEGYQRRQRICMTLVREKIAESHADDPPST